ncbi:hypothetical protein BV20DRAFT_1126453 [Pilatotrama ljubarskyi]|nr:hypothetical protein BV20DRAFT_1126453 [Pilatotrama ljubarskyi]
MLSSDEETYLHLQHHYPGKGPYRCSNEVAPGQVCNEGPYSDLQGLQRHIEATHLSWLGFACRKCGKQFARGDVMKNHKKKCKGGATRQQKEPRYYHRRITYSSRCWNILNASSRSSRFHRTLTHSPT